MNNQEIVIFQQNIDQSNQIYGQCMMCNILIPIINNSTNYPELCCDKCFILMNNINLWHSISEKLLYVDSNRTHNIFKHKSKDYYITCETVFNEKNKLIVFHYVRKMKILYCINCLKDSISFNNILDNYCPQCTAYNTISHIYYRWVIIADKYNSLNIIPKLKFLKKNNLSRYFIGPIEIYHQDYFNYDKIFLIKNIYLNQKPFMLISI